MMFLLVAPFIGMVIWVIAAFFALGSDSKHPYEKQTPIDTSLPEVPPPTEKGYVDDRTLAEKFDGRLTNIVRNPWEGIL